MSSKEKDRDEKKAGVLSFEGRIYPRLRCMHVRPNMTKGGGCHDLDDLCDTRDTLAFGVGKQLHNGRFYSYFARHSSDCAGGRPLSETMTLLPAGAKKANQTQRG